MFNGSQWTLDDSNLENGNLSAGPCLNSEPPTVTPCRKCLQGVTVTGLIRPQFEVLSTPTWNRVA